MKTEEGSAKSNLETVPYGKVMGIIKTNDQLQAISKALSQLGVHDVKVLDGIDGIKRLDSEEDAAAQCFLGDMEAPTVQHYLEAVKNGLIVFAVAVESETAAPAAEAAKAQGATEVVHFGSWVITNY